MKKFFDDDDDNLVDAFLQLVVIDVYNHRFHKVFMMSESVTHITERDDIYV